MSMGQENHPTPSEQPGAADSALRRKAASGRSEHGAKAMTLAKALRLSLAKSADKLLDMAMAALSQRLEEVAQTDLQDYLPVGGLLILLEGPHGRCGAALIDGALTGALVQQQTMGRVLPLKEGEERAPTDTDAALCAPFLERLLEQAGLLVEDQSDRLLLRGLQFGARAEDARQLFLALQAQDFMVARIGCDIAAGTRQGELTLCLPRLQSEEAAVMEGLEPGEEVKVTPPLRRTLLSEAVLELNADLRVALTQIRMPLRKVQSLSPGSTLDLPLSCFEQALVLSARGKVIARGSLGQVEGLRALRVTPRPEPAVKPQRRAEDRAHLPKEDLGHHAKAGGSIGVQSAGLPPHDTPQALEFADLPELSGIDDLSDLPELADLPPLEETGTG